MVKMMAALALLDGADKENLQLKEEQGKSSSTLCTPVRKPLQEINGCHSLPAVQRYPQYSQITPVTTPVARTPKHQAETSEKFKEDIGIPLNSLIYKKLNDILVESEKDYKKQLHEKDVYIASLCKRLSSECFESQTTTDHVSEFTDDVAEYVEDVIEKAKEELQHSALQRPSAFSNISKSRFFPAIGTPPSLALKRHRRLIRGSAGSDSDLIENADQSGLFKIPSLHFHNYSVSSENSLDIESQENTSTSGPKDETDLAVKNIETFVSDATEKVKPILSRSAIQCIDMTDDLVQPLNVDIDTQTDEKEFPSYFNDVHVKSASCFTRNLTSKHMPFLAISPVEVLNVANGEICTVSAGIETVITPPTPFKTDPQTSPCHYRLSPPRMVNGETGMTPVHGIGCGVDDAKKVNYKESTTCCSPILSHEAQTMVTPCKYADASQATTPHQTMSLGTTTTPVHLVSCETMITPIKYTDSGQCPSPTTCQDASAGTTPVRTVSMDTMVTPVRYTDSAQSPILAQIESTCCGTSPIRTTSVDTVMTPIHYAHAAQATSPVHTRDATTATSPFCHNMPRPSDLNFAELNPRNLASQLETAVISNTILRSELESLQTRLSVTRKHEAEARCHLGNVVNQSMLQEQISELMAQQSEALDQLSCHQKLLDEKEATIAKLEANKQRLKEANVNLQHDLVSAYKQKKLEVASLKEHFATRNYEPHFLHAQEHIRKLETELGEYVGLAEILHESQLKQNEAAAIIEKVAGQLCFQSKEHSQQWTHWQQQHTEWVEEIKNSRKAVKSASVDKYHLEQQIAQLLSQLQKAKETAKQATDESNELQGAVEQATFFAQQMESTTQELASVKYHLEQKEFELTQEKQKTGLLTDENVLLSKQLKEVESDLQELSVEMETTKAALESRSNYLNKLSSEKKGVNIILEGQRSLIKSLEEQIKSSKQTYKELETKNQQLQLEATRSNQAWEHLKKKKVPTATLR